MLGGRLIANLFASTINGFAFTLGSMTARELNKRYNIFPSIDEKKEEKKTDVKEELDELK